MTTRTELQAKSIKDLRVIADALGIESEGVQKAKLIGAIIKADGFEASDEPAPIDLPEAKTRKETPSQNGDGDSADPQGQRITASQMGELVDQHDAQSLVVPLAPAGG